ncbi:MAG: CRISPR-associated endonuclease Cas1 [Lachnoclostridium sp.]
MGLLYVNESGAVIGVEANKCTVQYKDGMKKMIPIESLEGITIMGRSQMTTQCAEECMVRGIPVAYFSKGGRYFGRLMSTGHINVERQRRQSELYDTEFSLQLSKNIINAKIKNQSVVLKRYEKSKGLLLNEEQKMMDICRNKVLRCERIEESIGFEGQAARYYFQGLSKCIDDPFKFQGRSRRPPLDEFNSMISLGYSILMNEVYCKVEMKGLNPYFGFLHRDAEKHPTLASDMMEEWRAVIVDATAMSMINGHEIHKEHFISDLEEPGYYLTKDGLKLYLNKLEKKFQTSVRYLKYVDYPVSFRRAILLQMEQLVKAIEKGDANLYEPLVIR